MEVIHCLFSVENNYDQPQNNLVCWWPDKPSLAAVASALRRKPLEEQNDAGVLFLVSLWKGEDVRDECGTRYRIEKIAAGLPLG